MAIEKTYICNRCGENLKSYSWQMISEAILGQVLIQNTRIPMWKKLLGKQQEDILCRGCFEDFDRFMLEIKEPPRPQIHE
jgi:hypothetical protein